MLADKDAQTEAAVQAAVTAAQEEAAATLAAAKAAAAKAAAAALKVALAAQEEELGVQLREAEDARRAELESVRAQHAADIEQRDAEARPWAAALQVTAVSSEVPATLTAEMESHSRAGNGHFYPSQ